MKKPIFLTLLISLFSLFNTGPIEASSGSGGNQYIRLANNTQFALSSAINEAERLSDFLQIFSHAKVESKYPMATATEGLNISTSRNAYRNGQFLIACYGEMAYIKVNNTIFRLKQTSFKQTAQGFNLIFKSSRYRIIINTTRVKELNSGMEGWSSFEGTVKLLDANDNLQQQVTYFYGEGI